MKDTFIPSKTLPPRKIYKINIVYYIIYVLFIEKLEKEKEMFVLDSRMEKWCSKPSLFPRLPLEKWQDEEGGRVNDSSSFNASVAMGLPLAREFKET